VWADFILNCPKYGEDRRSVGDWRKVVDELDILVMTGVQKYDVHRSTYPVKQAKSRDLVAHIAVYYHISVYVYQHQYEDCPRTGGNIRKCGMTDVLSRTQHTVCHFSPDVQYAILPHVSCTFFGANARTVLALVKI